MVTAIFPAAGKGKRMGAGMNKVFMELDGVPVLVRTLQRFSRCEAVDNLVVVAAGDELELVRGMLGGVAGLKPWQAVAGGSERQYSVWNGIQAVENAEDGDIILVHDAARPFVSDRTIRATIDMAREKGAAIAAVPAKNTIKRCNSDREVVETPDRSLLWEVQTPQGFRRDILIRANRQAVADGFLGTDDAGLVERLGEKVCIVESDYRNIKLTTPEDMVIGRAFLAEDREKGEIG
ncbi:2-C-methyl-D-erythritol 4-phosphate cytidylyltransferase [Anaerovibrio sp.]|uniref:2-C-methyl-D-erythritol 4-phosphate cytidylyltransferase n=1 Tax=Anaerovibrio sp. TaxID=1872532 RepID=UPI003F14474F